MSRAAFLAALGVALGLAAPISAQIGLSSAPQAVRLSAVKQGWVTVALPGDRPSVNSGLPNAMVATSWNVDPERTASVTLVAHFAGAEGAIPASTTPGCPTLPPGGTGVPDRARALFTQPIAAANAIGTRTDGLDIRNLPTPPGLPPCASPGTLSLVAITQ